MTITDQARNELYNTIREAFGDDAAATLMELLPPVGWADVARQRDLDHLAARLELRFDAIDHRFDAIDHRFDAVDHRFSAVDQRFDAMDQRFDAMDQRFDAMDQRFDGLDRRFDGLDQRFATRDDLHEQTTRFIGWMVASNATLVATVALIVSLVTTLR